MGRGREREGKKNEKERMCKGKKGTCMEEQLATRDKRKIKRVTQAWKGNIKE